MSGRGVGIDRVFGIRSTKSLESGEAPRDGSGREIREDSKAKACKEKRCLWSAFAFKSNY